VIELRELLLPKYALNAFSLHWSARDFSPFSSASSEHLWVSWTVWIHGCSFGAFEQRARTTLEGLSFLFFSFFQIEIFCLFLRFFV
jgi:hypothetical protein